MDQKGDRGKLSAVLSADVKGYSLFIRRNQKTPVRTLTEYRKVISKSVRNIRVESSIHKETTSSLNLPDLISKYVHLIIRENR